MRKFNQATQDPMTRFEYLKRFYDIDESDYQPLTRALKKKSFRKGDYLTIPGQVQRELYFVNRGVQMSYFDADRKMHVIAFTYPPDFCAIPESFSFQIPSGYYLYCLTDSDMDYITYPELERLFDQSQTLERLFRKATEAVLAGLLDLGIVTLPVEVPGGSDLMQIAGLEDELMLTVPPGHRLSGRKSLCVRHRGPS